MNDRNKRRLGWLTVALFAMSALLMPASTVLATTEHCPDGGTKTNQSDTSMTEEEFSAIVLDAGTSFCVKGSNEATEILVADGETTLKEYLNNGHDVSYYVVYETTTTTTTVETTTTTTEETTTTTEETTTTTDETTTTTGEVSGTTSEQTTTTATGNVSGTTGTGTTTLPETSMVDPVSPVNSGMISLAFLLLGVGSLLFLVLTPAKGRSRD